MTMRAGRSAFPAETVVPTHTSADAIATPMPANAWRLPKADGRQDRRAWGAGALGAASGGATPTDVALAVATTVARGTTADRMLASSAVTLASGSVSSIARTARR